MDGRNWRKNGSVFMAYASLFLVAFLFSAFLIRVFRLGLITYDTVGFLSVVQNFRLFGVNEFEWVRTPAFGFVQLIALQFPEPTLFLCWLFAGMFMINAMLVLWMVRPLYKTLIGAWFFALAVLLLEIALMRVFLYNVVMISDTFYAHLLMAGMLLVLGFYTRDMRHLAALFAGSALLGFAVFTRPASLSLIVVVAPFLLWIVWRMPAAATKKAGLASACFALLLGPNLLWSLRNEIVYGHFQVVAYGGLQTMGAVAEHIEDDDVVIPDSVKNREFLTALRVFESAFPRRYQDIYRWRRASGAPNVLQEVAIGLMPMPERKAFGIWPIPAERRMFFELDRFLSSMFIRVVKQHPRQYARQVLNEYRAFFAPGRLPDAFSIQPDTVAHWNKLNSIFSRDNRMKEDAGPYYPSGIPTEFPQNPWEHSVLKFMHAGMRLLPGNSLMAFFAAHTLLFLSVAVLLFFKGSTRRMHVVATAIVVLVMIAVSHNLIAAVTSALSDRYALPGEMPIHIAYVLFAVIILPETVRWILVRCRRE